jgi:hypothetical protein
VLLYERAWCGLATMSVLSSVFHQILKKRLWGASTMHERYFAILGYRSNIVSFDKVQKTHFCRVNVCLPRTKQFMFANNKADKFATQSNMKNLSFLLSKVKCLQQRKHKYEYFRTL